jgi:hypothetical protein
MIILIIWIPQIYIIRAYLFTSSIKWAFKDSINLYPPIALVCSDATIDTNPESTYKIVASQLIPPSLYTKIYLNQINNINKYLYRWYFITYISFKGSETLIP